MTISHKMQAALQFILPIASAYFLFANFLIFGRVPNINELREGTLAFGIICVASFLLQDLFPKEFKETLVFWKLTSRLPSHRAFSEIAQSSSEINEEMIPNYSNLKDLPDNKQQQEFYKIYRTFSSDPATNHKSQRYIAWRESATFCAMLTFATPVAFYSIDYDHALRVGTYLTLFCGFLYVATMLAARNVANSLVIHVLKLYSIEGPPNGGK